MAANLDTSWRTQLAEAVHQFRREFICRDPEGNLWCFDTYWPKAHEKPTG